MQYTMLLYMTNEQFAERADPARRVQFWASFLPYLNAIRESGIVVAGAGLQAPETATTVRVTDGKRHVQDGPFADSKEQLGGFFLLEVPNLDTALEWAARCPGDFTVEVRPNLPPLE
jgi:hypothetical protein